MLARLGVAFVFVLFAALPAVARSLDLSGESLVARAPSEAMIAALVAAPGWGQQFEGGDRITLARQAAWLADGRGITLANWRFPAARFDRATAAHINLGGATLTNASFDNANLIGADLTGARLRAASMRYADLKGARFALAATPVADLTSLDKAVPDPTAMPCTNYTRTDLSDADLRGADLSGTDLTCARMQRVIMDKQTTFDGKTTLLYVDFCGAHLSEVDFSKVKNLSDISFDGADLRNAILPSDFRWAYFRDAYLAGAVIQTAAGKIDAYTFLRQGNQSVLTRAHLAGPKPLDTTKPVAPPKTCPSDGVAQSAG